MESVMMIFFIILIVFFTYGYSSYYFYKHRTDQKTIFIPKSEELDSFVVGGQSNGQTNRQNDEQNSNNKGDENVGVKIDIMDNFTSPTEITRVAMFNKSGKNSFIQYNDYL
jgi:uncharacterized protein YxeA